MTQQQQQQSTTSGPDAPTDTDVPTDTDRETHSLFLTRTHKPSTRTWNDETAVVSCSQWSTRCGRSSVRSSTAGLAVCWYWAVVLCVCPWSLPLQNGHTNTTQQMLLLKMTTIMMLMIAIIIAVFHHQEVLKIYCPWSKIGRRTACCGAGGWNWWRKRQYKWKISLHLSKIQHSLGTS